MANNIGKNNNDIDNPAIIRNEPIIQTNNSDNSSNNTTTTTTNNNNNDQTDGDGQINTNIQSQNPQQEIVNDDWNMDIMDPKIMRAELTRFCMHLHDQGDSEIIQIVIELLDTKDVRAKHSVVERVTNDLMQLMRNETLYEAGIIWGNERHECFKSVLENYIMIYAAKTFIEKITTQWRDVVIAKIVADEVLQIPKVMKQLHLALEKMQFFNEHTAFKVYMEARPYAKAKILRELMLTRVSRIFLSVVSSSAFYSITVQELMHMLRHCYLSVNSEIEIFLTVILWLEKNWPERRTYAESLMSCVRFNLMPIWYLSTMEKYDTCSHFNRIVTIPYISAMINKAQIDAISMQEKEKTLDRDWIIDPQCMYHHMNYCRHFIYPSYAVFKQYLLNFNITPNYWRQLKTAKKIYVLKCCGKANAKGNCFKPIVYSGNQ